MILLAAAAKGAKGGVDSFLPMLVFMVPLVLFMWWMMRSAKKRERAEKQKREEMLASVRKSDSVITAGGIHGDVVSVGEKHVVLRVDGRKDVQIRFDKKAVREVLKKGEPAEKED